MLSNTTQHIATHKHVEIDCEVRNAESDSENEIYVFFLQNGALKTEDGEGVDDDYCVIGAGRQEPGCVQQPQERQE